MQANQSHLVQKTAMKSTEDDKKMKSEEVNRSVYEGGHYI